LCVKGGDTRTDGGWTISRRAQDHRNRSWIGTEGSGEGRIVLMTLGQTEEAPLPFFGQEMRQVFIQTLESLFSLTPAWVRKSIDIVDGL